MANPAETTPMMHHVVAYWDDSFEIKTEWHGRVVFPSKEQAYADAASRARLAGAPGQARVVEEYDVSYMIDRVVVEWITPVGSEQPKDIIRDHPEDRENKFIRRKIKLNKRLGEIPQ